jgi:hypothetical protein
MTKHLDLYNPKSPLAKAVVGDSVKINYVHADDSLQLQARVGKVGKVLGRTRYSNTPGNRYYIQFKDGYVGGFESWLFERAE